MADIRKIMISSAKSERRRAKMEVAPVHATVPTTWQKDYTSIPSSSRIDENLDRVSQTIYTVTTYDKAGKLDYYTSLRYLEYLV